MDISIVVPLYNEAESLPELVAWIGRVMAANGFSYEIILVDDGSTDASWSFIEKQAELDALHVRGIKFRRNYGKSAALNEGFAAAEGEVVITMDADMQDSPDELPELYRMVRDEGFDIVSGWKKKRYDPLTKTIPTKLYNWANRRISGIQLHDFNCGLKAYRSEVVKSIEVYGEMHRYIPVMAKWAGFRNIGEKVVQHRPRQYGVTKFGWERFINGPLDLLSITFVGRFGKRPMHFFGGLGTLSFIVGFLILAYLGFAKVYYQEYGMTDRPIFYVGILAAIIGVQLFLAGFLAEMLARTSPNRNNYQVEKRV
jgi:glycosyltransferase involved in cell wall biosynthesis